MKSEIIFEIELDDEKVPKSIKWNATDKHGDLEETNSISVTLWDHEQQNTMRIDLWTKEMQHHEMKRFYIDSLGGMAQGILNSTGDQFMADEINQLCEKLAEHVKKTHYSG